MLLREKAVLSLAALWELGSIAKKTFLSGIYHASLIPRVETNSVIGSDIVLRLLFAFPRWRRSPQVISNFSSVSGREMLANIVFCQPPII